MAQYKSDTEMTREQIEKAARDYALDQLGIVGLPGRAEAMKAFIAGAQWRIKSVWHDASEIPQHSGLLIAICKDGKAVLCGPNNSDWKTTVKIFHIVKWAYLDDLCLERKEETE